MMMRVFFPLDFNSGQPWNVNLGATSSSTIVKTLIMDVCDARRMDLLTEMTTNVVCRKPDVKNASLQAICLKDGIQEIVGCNHHTRQHRWLENPGTHLDLRKTYACDELCETRLRMIIRTVRRHLLSKRPSRLS